MLGSSQIWKRLIGLGLLGASFALAVGCTPSHPQSTFDAMGPVSDSQRTLFLLIFWTGIVVFVLVMGALFYLVFRYRQRAGDGDPEQVHGNTKAEVVWTIAPALVLVVIAVPTIFTLFDNSHSPEPPEKGGLHVEAIGHQWWFEFRYPGTEVVTANELHVPVGKVVNVSLNSADVIHSFWAPKLAGKLDMIPNNDNSMWFKADEPGEYFGQCAEFCGIVHALMRFTIVAQAPAEFDAWLAAQASDALSLSEPLAQQGEELFMSRQVGCFACHTIRGTERARGTLGPDLTHFADRQRFAGSILESTQENLRGWLHDPESLKPGNNMARNAGVYNGTLEPLTEPQISALIAYLRSLK